MKVGDTVKAGQEIVVLEAMKMENSVTTDYAGTVKQILAHPGDNVATDAVLVERSYSSLRPVYPKKAARVLRAAFF